MIGRFRRPLWKISEAIQMWVNSQLLETNQRYTVQVGDCNGALMVRVFKQGQLTVKRRALEAVAPLVGRREEE